MTVQPAEFVRSLAAMIGGRIEAYGAQLNADDLRLRNRGEERLGTTAVVETARVVGMTVLPQ